MGDEREREISRPSLADAIDLLDLVRVAEESARISTDSLPSPPPDAAKAAGAAEDFVDVGDEAEDVAPSVAPIAVETLDPALLPPELRPKGPNQKEAKPMSEVAPATEPGPPTEQVLSQELEKLETPDGEAPKAETPKAVAPSSDPPPSSPISGIFLVFGLVIAGLAGICALPSDPPVPPPAAKAALRPEPANLQVERNAEEPVESLHDDVPREPSH